MTIADPRPAPTVPSSSPSAWRLLREVAAWTGWQAGSSEDGGGGAAPQAGPFQVSHRPQPLPGGGTRLVVAIHVDGPEADVLGPLVQADVGELLAALQALAER